MGTIFLILVVMIGFALFGGFAKIIGYIFKFLFKAAAYGLFVFLFIMIVAAIFSGF